MKHIPIFFIIIFMFLLPVTYAVPLSHKSTSILPLYSDFPQSKNNTHFSGKMQIAHAFQYGTRWDVHFSIDVPVHDFVVNSSASSYNLRYTNMSDVAFHVNDIPTSVWKGGSPGYTLKIASAKLYLDGTRTYVVCSNEEKEPKNGWGDVATISLSAIALHVKENHDGRYFWRLSISLYYEHSSWGQTDSVTLSYTFVPLYHDFNIIDFAATGNYATDLSNGVVKAFSQFYNVWVVAWRHITTLDWNVIGFGTIDIKTWHFNFGIDFNKLFGNIASVFAIIAYSLFETFVSPLSITSQIMTHLQNALTVSFMLVMLVIVALLAIMIFIIMWKIILIIKP